MTHPDAEKWNGRYTQDGDHWRHAQPRRLLRDYAHLLPARGLALDAAAGVALHGRFLAARGLHVIALDISEVGLRHAQAAAAHEGVRLETAVMDFNQLWLPPARFDVIVNFRFLVRSTFPIYRRALKPGGLLIFETFVRTPTTTMDVDYYLAPGELRAAFAGFTIIHDVETAVTAANSRQRPVAQLVARRPISG